MKLLEEEDIIDNKFAYSYISFDKECNRQWVYFLIQWDEIYWYSIVYVWKSSNMANRIRSHYNKDVVPFTWYSHIITSDNDSWFLEQMYITKFMPFYNISYWTSCFIRKSSFFGMISKAKVIINKQQKQHILNKFSFEVLWATHIQSIYALRYLWFLDSIIWEMLWF